MLTVQDVWDDAKSIFGNCSDLKVYERLSDAIELLTIKGEWDPLKGYVDLCCPGQEITLPTEVETPMAVLINGHPSLAHDALFAFHLNGPGDDWQPCRWAWIDQGTWPTYQDLPGPRNLYAYSTDPADIGKSITIYGQDDTGGTLCESAPPQDGMLIPIQYTPSAVTPVKVSRIFRVTKPVTAGRIKIAAVDYSNANCDTSGTLVSDMQYWETNPQYRRIRLAQAAQSVRVFFRRKTARVAKLTDLIPLHNRLALVTAMQAVQAYRDNRIDLGLSHEAQAVRWLSEKESSLTPPGGIPMQVNIAGGIYDPTLEL